MPKKRHGMDQIIRKLRQADVELGKGKKVPETVNVLILIVAMYCRDKRRVFGLAKV